MGAGSDASLAGRGAAPSATAAPSTAAASHTPTLALLVGRWGAWPGWTPLLLRTCAANPTVDFMLLSDVSPVPEGEQLPPNVRHVYFTLDMLLTRMRACCGCTLRTHPAGGMTRRTPCP